MTSLWIKRYGMTSFMDFTFDVRENLNNNKFIAKDAKYLT